MNDFNCFTMLVAGNQIVLDIQIYEITDRIRTYVC